MTIGKVAAIGKCGSTVVVMCVLTAHAVADSGTWIKNDSGNWSDPDNWSGGVVADGNGNTANFGTIDITADRTVTLDTPRIISNLIFGDTDRDTVASWIVNGVSPNMFNFENDTATLTFTANNGVHVTVGAGTGGSGTDAGDGNKISKQGNGKVTLGGQINLVGNVNIGLNAQLFVEGGGELEITGYVLGASASQVNRGNGTSNVGETSSGNVFAVTGTGRMYIGGIRIGGSTFGGNTVMLSSPGSVGNPTYRMAGNGAQLNMGESSSGNTMTVSNGAYLYVTQGGGTMTWTLGTNAGANDNQIIITGAGSTVDRTAGSGSAIFVGAAGDGNRITVAAGGRLFPRRLAIGQNGGGGNFVRVSGAGSLVSAGADSNQSFAIGSNKAIDANATVGGDGNYLRIESGGTVTFDGNANRGYNVGAVNGADDNYIVVDGVGSTFTMRQGQPFSIGGATGSNNGSHFITDSTASGNYLAVINGGKTVQNSVYVMGNSDGAGTGSKFILGNGTSVSTPSEASVSISTGNPMYAPGITLYNSYAQLVVNNGRLIASTGGALVSGAGQVQVDGPAFFSTEYANSFDSAIVGPGSLTKQGAGTLTLTATNFYSGDTIVEAGSLGLGVPCLDDEADVYLTTGTTMQLNFDATDVIGGLYIDDVKIGAGTYGATASRPSFFSGPGKLRVLGTAGVVLTVR